MYQISPESVQALIQPSTVLSGDGEDINEEILDVPYTYEVEEEQEKEYFVEEIVEKLELQVLARYPYKGKDIEMEKGEACITQFCFQNTFFFECSLLLQYVFIES